MSTQHSSLRPIQPARRPPFPPTAPALHAETTFPRPDLSPFTRAVPFIQTAIRQIRRVRTATHLLTLADDFSALHTLLISANQASCSLNLLPQPFLSNYQAHLRTLSFELRRARYLLLQERTRLQSHLTPIQ